MRALVSGILFIGRTALQPASRIGTKRNRASIGVITNILPSAAHVRKQLDIYCLAYPPALTRRQTKTVDLARQMVRWLALQEDRRAGCPPCLMIRLQLVRHLACTENTDKAGLTFKRSEPSREEKERYSPVRGFGRRRNRRASICSASELSQFSRRQTRLLAHRTCRTDKYTRL